MASEHVMEFTTDNWDKEVVQSDVPVLVDFWAPWCGPCRLLGPTIERIAEQYNGKLKVGKLNIDDNQGTAVEFGINSIPQVLIFKGKPKPQEKVVGLVSERELTQLIDRVLQPTA